MDQNRFLAGIQGYIQSGGSPIPPQPWIFGLWVDTWARWAEHHTELHRFDQEPEKFNPPTCARTIQRAVNLLATIEQGHQSWLGEIQSLNATVPGQGPVSRKAQGMDPGRMADNVFQVAGEIAPSRRLP